MATRSVTRAIREGYHSPSRLIPFLVQQQRLFRGVQEDADKTLHVFSSQSAFSPFSEKTSKEPWIPGSDLGFSLHRKAGKGHAFLFSLDTSSSCATLSVHVDRQLPSTMQRPGIKLSLPLSQEKVQMQDFTYCNPESIWKLTNLNYLPPSTEMDEVILPSLNEANISPMLMSTKRTFNPSTIVRKRRHGFLARKATVGGRRVLARRFAKGRRRLSA